MNPLFIIRMDLEDRTISWSLPNGGDEEDLAW